MYIIRLGPGVLSTRSKKREGQQISRGGIGATNLTVEERIWKATGNKSRGGAGPAGGAKVVVASMVMLAM